MNTGVAFIVHVNSAASSEAFSTLFLEFGSMLLVLGLLAMLARKLDISAIPFYLIAGLILGQGGFDVIEFGNSRELSAKSTFIDRMGLQDSAFKVADVLGCPRPDVSTQLDLLGPASVSVVLGADFTDCRQLHSERKN